MTWTRSRIETFILQLITDKQTVNSHNRIDCLNFELCNKQATEMAWGRYNLMNGNHNSNSNEDDTTQLPNIHKHFEWAHWDYIVIHKFNIYENPYPIRWFVSCIFEEIRNYLSINIGVCLFCVYVCPELNCVQYLPSHLHSKTFSVENQR